jgi:hypothetical protein
MARLAQPAVLLVGPPKPGMPPPDARQWLIDNDLLWDDGIGSDPGDRRRPAGTRAENE